MQIGSDKVAEMARLARLELESDEIKALTVELSGILEYVAKLQQLDTTGVEPVSHALAVVNAFREDEVAPSLSREEALANAPAATGEAFVVPKVF
ncbi:Asp-tRNA(Asn)/Glu-tRNA(Gln) amidotransferase subunit GatC [Desulfurivibrio alkaliphilus]|uniref:Aspartyl/glutamyl-tRNA(Asn/Gln) amidotransferase subunit C n=1 Tax=Desulfurivibrio alkaliphilus (strain DSM 19089 / UNIQEM U267 / AHT2) TaxID=589865 RepID=D6Z1J5_DESAT|nr:Asp-tRNA(Asn)/Glu-tRNA(Gln) amidotransferase subunit GatC [Desulfurivibrio alkaliphilus]ADH87329.1 glutamyl-tRNA(Gln) amidotransferase, C subunit [Desulfurivibrio alkaliphilus AHT 2]